MQKMNVHSSRASTRTTKSALLNRSQVRSAVRFPLMLRMQLDAEAGDLNMAATTMNVSASGVLFELDRPLAAGRAVRFSLCMPGAVLGTSQDVVVHCRGRVVRCSMSHNQHYAAATIEEYEFARSGGNMAARASA